MRTLLLLATLALLVVAVPTTAEAHVEICLVTDPVCIAECTAAHARTPPLMPGHGCKIIVQA